jgi:hypothetical protein
LREGFAYNTLRSKSDKIHKKGVHSLWEDVSKSSYNVCETYARASLLNDGKPHEVMFHVVLPITDILSLQAFTLYHNFCLSDLELKFYVKPDALVVAQLSAVDSLKLVMERDFSQIIELNLFQNHQRFKFNMDLAKLEQTLFELNNCHMLVRVMWMKNLLWDIRLVQRLQRISLPHQLLELTMFIH